MPRRQKYPEELYRRGVRSGLESGRPISHIARDIGLPAETLRKRVRQLEHDEGLRVSELIGLLRRDISLDRTAPHIRVSGKGRKERITPLTAQTATVLRDWVAASPGEPTDPLFTTDRGGPLSRDAVERLLTKHANTAAATCPTLRTKRSRRTCSLTPARCNSCTLASTRP